MNKFIDFFKQKDKQKHILCCFIISIINPILGVLAGVGKELYDSYQPNNKWDWMDIVADIIGIAIGTCIWLII